MKLVGFVLVFSLICGIATNALYGADAAPARLGSAGFVPSPTHPFGWRGDGSGCFLGATPPTQWSATKNIRWSTTVGKSYSSPILTEKLAIVTVEPNFIVAVNRADGKQAWKTAVAPADLSDPKSRKGAEDYILPKAGSGMSAATPVTDGKSIYMAFANGIVCALDLSGKIQWTAYIDADQNTGYGRSSSPILTAGKLIVHMTNLYAFDPATGKQIWVNTDAESTYGTPAAFTLDGVDLIATPRGHVVRADNGKVVAEDIAHSGTPSPIAHDGMLYYGDVSVSAIQLSPAFKDTEVWNAMIGDEVFGSPIFYDHTLFIVTGKGGLYMFDARGKGEQTPLIKPPQLLADGDPDSGAPPTFSCLALAGKYLYLNSNQGEVVVLEATREAKVVARNKLPEGSASTPVFCGKEMFLRSGDKLLCIGE
ncbi:MAG TPA: PQQ-binding-like beta-propeller repeat protein [Tepidisphaeraceae bacterium]|nr:PQQ-binding-like beta-propeller repeat protein [Tepidisphaeraceae bacterium]